MNVEKYSKKSSNDTEEQQQEIFVAIGRTKKSLKVAVSNRNNIIISTSRSSLSTTFDDVTRLQKHYKGPK